MDQETLWREYAALPDEARRKVDEFIASLASRYTPVPQPATQEKGPLDEEPFIGMWHDHDDLTDSSAWVRSSREREWTRPGG